VSERNTTLLAAIGDLHGHAPALEALLAALERRGGFFEAPGRLAPGAKLVLTGDYIDRGTSALAIIARLRELRERNPGQVVTLLGNHELLALQHLDAARALAGRDPGKALASYAANLHGENGGDAFVREFGGPGGEGALASYVERMSRGGDVGDWIRSLAPLHTDRVARRTFLFSHGDLPEALLAEGAAERYGVEVSLRMQAPSEGMGGAVLKYGDQVFTSSTGSLFWCRDFRRLVGASPRAAARVCERAGVDFIVTGHTMHPGNVVDYGGRIFDIDVGMTPGYGRNEPQALLVTEAGIASFMANGRERTLVGFPQREAR
jgi:hypothetical protein